MRFVLLCVFVLLLIVTGSIVFSIDIYRLNEFGWGYFTGKAMLMLLSLAGLFFTGRSIFKKISA
ncbi:hypothetical protein [Pontibacter populi]|uniref:Uncharacterized protein n=1 Tax=Pontibacter populi TaxID=890055 RepID=A0ABV1RPA7_9BACT